MAYITSTLPTAEWRHFSQNVRQYLKAWAANRKAQREYRQMLELSNRDLRDIGITRDDVREQMTRKVMWYGAI